VLVAVALAVTAADGVSDARASTPAPAAFNFNFDGNPSAPQAWMPANWDVVVNSRDTRTFAQLEGMNAQHGADCGPYPATHFNNTYSGAVFLCRNHVMTAINAGGYGEIVLTPDHMVDFAGGAATIKFNLSTLRTSFRDWVSIWITPFEDNLVLPIDPGERVDLQGPPKEGILVRMDAAGGGTVFRAMVIHNFKATNIPLNVAKTVEKLVTASAVTRTTFQLTISQTHLTFGAPTLGFNWVDTNIGPLPWSMGVVQLAHHSYNPAKHCTPTPTLICQPDTWHWSNFYISSAIPFTLLRADQQTINPADSQLGAAATPTVATFPAPAPTSSLLRFAAVGAIDISVDGGKTWQAAQRQLQEYSAIDHFSSYFTPVPSGTTKVSFRGHNWGYGVNPGNPWWIRDVAIWSTSTQPGTSAPAAASAPSPAHSSAVQAQARPVLSTLLAALRTPAGIGASAGGLLILLGASVALLVARRRRSKGRSKPS